jgi:hypothetical protein
LYQLTADNHTYHQDKQDEKNSYETNQGYLYCLTPTELHCISPLVAGFCLTDLSKVLFSDATSISKSFSRFNIAKSLCVHLRNLADRLGLNNL